jgi:undecaprenyl-diphosphatase
MPKKIKENIPLVRPLLFFLLTVIFLVFFLHITDEVIREKEYVFDLNIIKWINGIRFPWLTTVMNTITFLGSFYFLLPGYLIIAVLLYRSDSKATALFFAAISIIGALMILAAKYLFHRTRPDMPFLHAETGFSFPSGHATSSVIFFGWLVYLLFMHFVFTKPVKWLICLLAILVCAAIGFSRVYLEVHYATDVLAGYCLGTLYFLVTVFFREKFF